MFKWITNALKRITAAHRQGKFPFNNKGFALGEGETHEEGFTRLETELATAKEAGSKGFYGGLSEELRGNPSMMKFKESSNEDIAKSYINLQGKISAKGLTIPGKNAPEQEVKDFYTALGRPDTADGYQITLAQDLHKSIVSNSESQKVFKTQCHKEGLSATQTQNLHTWYMTELSNVLKQQDEADDKAMKEGETALTSKWGTTYEAKKALAVKVVNKFAGEKAQELLDKGLGSDPAMLEMFADIGDKLSEDVLGPGGKSKFGALTPEAAQAQINEIRGNPKSAYNDGQNPLHKEAVEEMTGLYTILSAAEKKD